MESNICWGILEGTYKGLLLSDPPIDATQMVQMPVGAQFVLVFPSDATPVRKKGLKKVFIGYLRLEVDDFYYTEIALTDVDIECNYSCWELMSCTKLQQRCSKAISER